MKGSLCEGSWGRGVVTLKDIISRPFNYAEQIAHIQLLIGCVWGNDWYRLLAIQSHLTVK